ncbi:MAG: hypothetical protein N3F10_02645 [Candidatus Bathyarchaeota archaeon]|nr:hypothetical protein [Candidatus Bathyarchaeota archaeon]
MAWLLEKEIKRELPAEWGGIVPTEIFFQEAQGIVENAKNEGVTLRILGGLAIAIHSPEHREFARKLGRTGTGMIKGQEYSDLDFIGYSGQRNRVKEFFDKLGYVKRRATLSTAASERQIYYHPKGWFYVDIFFDKLLVANHPIDFRGRLELDYPTITVTDMLLEKIQMWEAFSIKDLKDCLLLLKAHGVSEGHGREQIDTAYIARLLAQDWGFWYTATTNLKKLRKFVSELDRLGKEAEINPADINGEEREEIIEKIDVLLERVEKEPKTLGWKMRAKVGTKKKWYNPVERPDTVGGFGIWEAMLNSENKASPA